MDFVLLLLVMLLRQEGECFHVRVTCALGRSRMHLRFRSPPSHSHIRFNG